MMNARCFSRQFFYGLIQCVCIYVLQNYYKFTYDIMF